MSQENIQKFRSWIAGQGLDAFIVSLLPNVAYLSGWHVQDEEACWLLVSADQQILLTNPLYQQAAAHDAVDWNVVVPDGRAYATMVVELARQYGWHKIGFEAGSFRYGTYEKLRVAGDGVFILVPYDQTVLDTLRLVKQPYELELLRHAIAITDETFAHICDWIQPGMTERQVSWEISRTMVESGADGTSFSTIVASGPNGAMPHSVPGDRVIQRGELVTIDMGARYKGYCADMTRTICLGEPAEPRMQEVYAAVLHAMKTCEQGLGPHLTGIEGDALARDVLAEAGLAHYFIHSTGHGVGLEIHERPNLSLRASPDQRLPVGCVVTVEPGIYIPEWTGTRVEDCVLITEHGAEVLTQSPTDLVIAR